MKIDPRVALLAAGLAACAACSSRSDGDAEMKHVRRPHHATTAVRRLIPHIFPSLGNQDVCWRQKRATRRK